MKTLKKIVSKVDDEMAMLAISLTSMLGIMIVSLVAFVSTTSNPFI